MPRIDPLQLITCLQVLLSPTTGGILSNHEVSRLVSLVTKFSKKLVSKCVYVLILKSTESSLLDAFMNAGGWTLVQLWLHDAMFSSNWALVKELLELLLITPVDVERLKANNIPKLVKGLSKREDLQGVHELSTQLVQQWLSIVKGETNNTEQRTIQISTTPFTVSLTTSASEEPVDQSTEAIEEDARRGDGGNNAEELSKGAIDAQTFYKVTLKDGKHLISKVDPEETGYEMRENIEFVEVKGEPDEDIKEKDVVKEKEKDSRDREKDKRDDKKRSNDKSRHRSSSKSSSSRDKERSSHKDRDKHSSGSSSSSSNSSKDRDRNKDKDKRDKDRRKSSSSSKSSKSSSSSSSSKEKDKDKKETREKQAEKDKDTLAKLQPQSVQKLPKIPKKAADDKDKNKSAKESLKEEPKKGTMSIEVRKINEERPKTVKVYKSKMRSTGLEEEAKPAPPRPTKKPAINAPVVIPPTPLLKRPSPIRDLTSVPPEKKTKMDAPPLERPGAIKLIPPKPKPPVLQESDMFMDALAASATAKKEPKKRKRRASVSKDSTGTSPPSSPSQNLNSVTSPIGLKNMAPPKFYQDTLEAEESKPETIENDSGKENADNNRINETCNKEDRTPTPTEDFEEEKYQPVIKNGLKSVLVYMRKKGPKKSIKWKPDEELVDIQYFELDETERVNVTKTFGDMAKMDVRSEREALQMSRKLQNEDVMDSQIPWRIPMEIDLPEPLATPGSKSLEKDIQFAREKSVLQALYFNKKMLPDTPGEPDPENYQIKDPVLIPVDDVDNPEHDYRNKPWPEPKGSPPPLNISNNIPSLFPNNVPVNFQTFNAAPQPTFQNVQQNIQQFAGPPFMSPNVMGGDWNNVNIPNMHNAQMMPPNMTPPEMMNQGPINPNMYMHPPENFNPMMNDNNHRFPPPFNQHQQPPGMFPQNNFNTNRGGYGAFRRGGGGGGGSGGGGGNGPWLRMNGPPPNGPGGWNNNMRGGGGGGGGPHRGARLCNNFRNKGFCRNRDSCPFFHPN